MTSLQRLQQLIPKWFGTFMPVVTGILAGFGAALDSFAALQQYILLQMRISSATDGFLDLIAGDFFGQSLGRNQNEADNSYRARILSSIFAPVVTRSAIIARLYTLTGRVATIFEPGNPSDTGGYNIGGCGYGVAGGWGSLIMPGQFFVYPHRPTSSGIPYVTGYGGPAGGYSTPSTLEYANPSMSSQSVPDSAIYALIAKIKAAGCTAWVQISN